MKHTQSDLKIMQSWSLERKIQVTQTRIIEWYQHWQGQVYVSFSGGKDSTVLLDLARRCYPDIEAVFVNTGLEYPEIKQFVKTKENVTWLRPKMQFADVIIKYGYPIIGKEIAQGVKYARKNDDSRSSKYYKKRFHGTLQKNDGTKSNFCCEKYNYLLDAPFGISGICCNVMKKKPFHDYEKKTGKRPFIGTMTEESRQRKSKWLQDGCNSFNNKKPSSKPMSFWTETDVLAYIKKFNLPYCSIYGNIKEVGEIEGQETMFGCLGKLETTGVSRTGCVFCGFGCHLEKEPNRFQRMKTTHPKLYNYCINGGEYIDGLWQPNKQGLGMGKVLDFIGVKY